MNNPQMKTFWMLRCTLGDPHCDLRCLCSRKRLLKHQSFDEYQLQIQNFAVCGGLTSNFLRKFVNVFFYLFSKMLKIFNKSQKA